MSDKFFHLSSCSTCKRIIKELGDMLDGVEMVDVKARPITAEELDLAAKSTDGYDALVNKRSQTLRKEGINVKELNEQQKRDLILSHYSLLKRPLLIANGTAVAGNSAAQVEAMKATLGAS